MVALTISRLVIFRRQDDSTIGALSRADQRIKLRYPRVSCSRFESRSCNYKAQLSAVLSGSEYLLQPLMQSERHCMYSRRHKNRCPAVEPKPSSLEAGQAIQLKVQR